MKSNELGRRRRTFPVVWFLVALSSCTPAAKKGPERDAAPAERDAGPAEPKAAPAPLVVERDPSHLEDAELARLVRSSDSESRKMLIRQLLGEPSARSWAALGLGLTCEKSEPKSTVALLTSAVATWMGQEEPPSFEHLAAAAWAIGACAVDESEVILSSWLQPDTGKEWKLLGRAAAEGLGAFADRRGRLTERTQSAILSAAGREKDPAMLLSLGRVHRLSDAVGAHLLEVVGQLLTQKSVGSRRPAIFALGRAGPSAAEPLGQVFLASEYDSSERAAAAQALGGLGPEGQEVLDQVVFDVLSKGLPRRFDDARWIPLRAALAALERPVRSQAVLSKIASAPITQNATSREAVADRRRLVWLRCRAEDLKAGQRFDASGLLRCDPDEGRFFLLAQIRVLDRGKITGPAAKRVAELCEHPDPVVSEAALRLYAAHPELTDAKQRLLSALASEVAGLRTTAAQIISAYPHRVFSKEGDAPPEDVIAALSKILEDDQVPLETQAATLRAAGASRALTLKPVVEKLCDSPHEALWSSAETALALLGSPKKQCGKPATAGPTQRGLVAPVLLVAQTDLGPVTLRVDSPHAPASVTHFLGLVDAGFYDGMAVHAAREGFAVQFGDKNGDSYDDVRAPGLPNEVAPEPFEALSFGMGAFAPGTQNTQIFVLLADAPQLTGTRVRLGVVEGDAWDHMVVGDVIHSLKRKTP